MPMKKDKDTFTQRLAEAKKHLPYRYGSAVRAIYPQITYQRLHNVMNAGLQNWEVLAALEDIAGRQKKFLKKSKESVAF
jgi:hypothetical protein